MNTNPKCSRCKRPLSNPKSVVNGMGPVCASKAGRIGSGTPRQEPLAGMGRTQENPGLGAPSLVVDALHHYAGYHRPEKDAVCRVRIYKGQTGNVMLLTELPENTGLSVTNGVEKIAAEVAVEYNLNHAIIIEHYPDRRGPQDQHDTTLAENFSLVNFRENHFALVTINGESKVVSATLKGAQWSHLDAELVIAVIEGRSYLSGHPAKQAQPAAALA